MNKNKKHFLNALWLAVIAASTLLWGCSCKTSKPTPDPLAGFHVSSLGNLDNNKAITDDYRNYIQNLPSEEKKYLGNIFYFENENGQHAVRIETDIGGKDAWYHILFYDKDSKRVRVIKYFKGTYIS